MGRSWNANQDKYGKYHKQRADREERRKKQKQKHKPTLPPETDKPEI
jgi:hypothetical protein